MILSHLILVLLDLVTGFTMTASQTILFMYTKFILHTSYTFLYEVFINNVLRMPDRVKLQAKSTKYKD